MDTYTRLACPHGHELGNLSFVAYQEALEGPPGPTVSGPGRGLRLDRQGHSRFTKSRS